MDEAFGMDAVGGIENGLALFEDERGLLVVDHGRREQRQAGVAMFLIVPAKESLTERRGLECTRSGLGTPANISGCGTDFPNTDCHPRHADGCGFS